MTLHTIWRRKINSFHMLALSSPEVCCFGSWPDRKGNASIIEVIGSKQTSDSQKVRILWLRINKENVDYWENIQHGHVILISIRCFSTSNVPNSARTFSNTCLTWLLHMDFSNCSTCSNRNWSAQRQLTSGQYLEFLISDSKFKSLIQFNICSWAFYIWSTIITDFVLKWCNTSREMVSEFYEL